MDEACYLLKEVHGEFFDSWYVRVSYRVVEAVRGHVWIILSVILSSAFLLATVKPKLDKYPESWLLLLILLASLFALKHLPEDLQWAGGEDGKVLHWWLKKRKRKRKTDLRPQYGGLFKDKREFNFGLVSSENWRINTHPVFVEGESQGKYGGGGGSRHILSSMWRNSINTCVSYDN